MNKKRKIDAVAERSGAPMIKEVADIFRGASDFENKEVAEIVVPAGLNTNLNSQLKAALEDICRFEGVNGYILKDTSIANINLEKTQINHFALLASHTSACFNELGTLFSLGNFKSTIVECERKNFLCIQNGEITVNILMDKNADIAKIQRIISELK